MSEEAPYFMFKFDKSIQLRSSVNYCQLYMGTATSSGTNGLPHAVHCQKDQVPHVPKCIVLLIVYMTKNACLLHVFNLVLFGVFLGKVTVSPHSVSVSSSRGPQQLPGLVQSISFVEIGCWNFEAIQRRNVGTREIGTQGFAIFG